jgi:hypothetical protein
MNIPRPTAQLEQVKFWLSKTKKKYMDNWKLAINKAIYEDQIPHEDIHPEILRHLNRKKP